MKSTFRQFITTLNATFEVKLTQEDKGYESRSENLYIPTPLSRVLRVYNVSTVDDLSFNLANFNQPLHLQSSMWHPHLINTDAAVSHATASCSPALMMKVTRDPVIDAAYLPVPIPATQTPGKQMFHLQYAMSCVTMSHP